MADPLPVQAAHELTTAEVEDLEESRRAAMLESDVDRLDELLAESLTWTHGSGKVDDKAAFLDGFRTGGLRCHALTFSDRRITVFGGVAVVTGRIDMDVEVAGERRTTANRFTTAWLADVALPPRQLFWHSCRVPSPEAQPTS